MVVNKSKAAFRTIAEVADELDIGTHVLRFWETKFPQIKPMKRSGGRRYYRPDDVELLNRIKELLYNKRYTIEGVQKLFKEKGVKAFLGEKIQDELFADSNSEAALSSDNSEIIKGIIEELNAIRSDLKEAII